jgi:programmed cell death protein 5
VGEVMSVEQDEQTAADQAAAQAAISESMRTLLTPDARGRLARVELAYPDLANSVKEQLHNLHSTERIATPVDDATLKRILQGMSENNRRDTTIRRI